MNDNNQWAQPTPLRPDGTNLLPFPVNALPPIIGDMAQAIATTTSTDVAMAGTSILSAVSYCFSGVYRMSAKRDHTEPLVLDTLTIAEPSFKKSPVMSLIKRPYIQFAHDWNENNKQDIFTAQAERKLLQSKLEALEKKKDVTAEEIAKLQTELSNIPPSNFRRIAVDDVTPESLVNLLEENGTLLMISDEAGMLGNFSGRYSNNVPNLDLLLKSWNGETYISDRATRASIVLKKPYMSICLACQPYVFDGMINNPVFRGSGLIARFMYCFPVSNIGSRKDRIIIIVADNEDVLATVKAFVKERELDETLIGYRIESFEDMIPDGYTVDSPVTNEELETLVTTLQALNIYLYEKGFTDNSAYASLYWGKHAIECYAQSYAVEYEIKQFMKENDIDENLISVIVAPEADYREPTGGQRSHEEVNTIVASEYITLKKYLTDNVILSNVYLTTKGELDYPKVPYSCVQIYVRSQEDADTLKAYMEDNYYWKDVVEVTVQPNLSVIPDNTIHNKAYVCLAGDSNDDGEFGISDVVKLQKYLLASTDMQERQIAASDLTDDGCVDVFDLSLSKRNLIQSR